MRQPSWSAVGPGAERSSCQVQAPFPIRVPRIVSASRQRQGRHGRVKEALVIQPIEPAFHIILVSPWGQTPHFPSKCPSLDPRAEQDKRTRKGELSCASQCRTGETSTIQSSCLPVLFPVLSVNCLFSSIWQSNPCNRDNIRPTPRVPPYCPDSPFRIRCDTHRNNRYPSTPAGPRGRPAGDAQPER